MPSSSEIQVSSHALLGKLMRLREITKKQLQEGMFDAKTPEKIAAQAAQKLQAQGYGQRKPLPPVQDSVPSNSTSKVW
jgi:hypothetical protein